MLVDSHHIRYWYLKVFRYGCGFLLLCCLYFHDAKSSIYFPVQALAVLSYNVCYARYLGYTAIELMAEINSIFLHGRKLMQMAGVKLTNPVYRTNVLVNLVMVLACRLGASSFLLYHALTHRSSLSFSFIVILSSGLVVALIINAFIFWRLLRNDVLRPLGLTRGHSGKDRKKDSSESMTEVRGNEYNKEE